MGVGIGELAQGNVEVARHDARGRLTPCQFDTGGGVGRVERGAVGVPFEDEGREGNGHVPGVFCDAGEMSFFHIGTINSAMDNAHRREEGGVFDTLNSDGTGGMSGSLTSSPASDPTGGGAATARGRIQPATLNRQKDFIVL